MECLAGKLRPPVVLTLCSSGEELFLTEEYCKEILYLYSLFPEALKHDKSAYFLRLEETYSKVSVIKDFAELDEKLENIGFMPYKW